MSVRYHVLDYWCNSGGRRDYGAFPTFWDAAKEVARRIDSGERGGCRCRPGFTIKPCGFDTVGCDHEECQPYDENRFRDCDEDGEITESDYENGEPGAVSPDKETR